MFDVSVSGPPGTKDKGLSFDLQGEGDLPQISITRPLTYNAKHQPLLLFNKLLLNHVQELQVAVTNMGSIPATMAAHLASDENNAFTLIPPHLDSGGDVNEALSVKSNEIPAGKTREIIVRFKPTLTKQYKSTLRIRVKHNQFESTSVQLIGEGYQADLSLEKIRGPPLTFDEMETITEDAEGPYCKKTSREFQNFTANCKPLYQSTLKFT